MMPFGSIVAVVALAWCVGRGRTLAELRRGGTKVVPDLLFFWLKYIVPLGIGFTIAYEWAGRLFGGD